MTRMEFLLQGDFLGLIKAEVFITASYSLSFSFAGAQFYVRVTVDLAGINNVRKSDNNNYVYSSQFHRGYRLESKLYNKYITNNEKR